MIWRFLISNKLEQLEFKLEKLLGFRNMQEKLKMYILYFSVVRPVLIISIALSGVYLIFSILLLKGIKEVR